MTTYAIEASGLAKRYRIGARINRHPTVRDAVAYAASRFLRPNSGPSSPGEFWALLDRVALPHLRAIFGPALSLQGQGCVVAPGSGTASSRA